MAVKAIPDGYHSVTPYVVVEGLQKLIEFVKQAFGATELHRFADSDGTIRHAKVKIGDSIVMMGESSGQWKRMPASIQLYVQNSDAVYKKALQSGGVSIMEDVSPEEMKKRAEAAMTQHAKKG